MYEFYLFKKEEAYFKKNYSSRVRDHKYNNISNTFIFHSYDVNVLPCSSYLIIFIYYWNII